MVDWIEHNVEVDSRKSAIKYAQVGALFDLESISELGKELLSLGFFRHVFRNERFAESHIYRWHEDQVSLLADLLDAHSQSNEGHGHARHDG
jgi:uncharacterized protein YfaA (DUF2138 family)